MLNRIQRIIDYYKLTSSAFADKVGVPRSTISHVLSGRNNPSLDFVMKILSSFSQVNIDWLINGTGPMLKVSNSLFPDEDLDGFGPDISQNEISEEEDMPGIKDEHLVTGLNFVKEEEEPSVNESFRKEEEYDSPAMVRSEDRVEYNRNLPPKKGKTTKVIVLYDDGTFSEYTPR